MDKKEKEVKKADDTVDIEEIEVGKGTKEISKENQDDFETFVQQYKGSIKEKCREEYGSDDEKLFNDTAKEMFLDIINHVPVDPTTEIKNSKEEHKEEEKMEESCNKKIKEKNVKKEDWDEKENVAENLRDMLDEGILSTDEFVDMCLAYLSTDDIYELCRLNGILPEDVYDVELAENCSKKTEGWEKMYTVEELVSEYPEAEEVEFYTSTVPERYWRGIHTDFIADEDDLFNSPVYPTDTELFKKIDKKYNILDYELMDEEEYNNTVLANGDIDADFEGWYGNKDAEVLVIVLTEKDDDELEENCSKK